MGAIIPVMSGGGGGWSGGGYPRRQVDNSGAQFLAAMMGSDRYQSRSDPNATLALVLQLAMQKDSLAENRRQFEALLAERSGQFEEQKKNEAAMRDQIQAGIDLSRNQFNLMQDQYRDQRSDVTELRRRMDIADARARAADVATNTLNDARESVIAAADIGAKKQAVQTAATQAAFAEEVGKSAERVSDSVSKGFEWFDSGQAPSSYKDVVDFATQVESRALAIKDPSERARFANEASLRVGEMLDKVGSEGFDTTSPLADVNPVSWLWGGARAAVGLPYNAADATYKKSAIDRLRSARSLLGKLGDPAINEREALQQAESLSGKLSRLKAAERGVQADLSRLGAKAGSWQDFANYEAGLPDTIGRMLSDDPNAATTTSAPAPSPASRPYDWSAFEQSLGR